MAETERRSKQALDESYRYYRRLEDAGSRPELYKIVKSFITVTAALNLPQQGSFKLTKQLWRMIHRALFDTLITSFPGYVIVTDEEDEVVKPQTPFPEEGVVEFHPDGCKRATDIFQNEIKSLMAVTRRLLAKAWEEKGARVSPGDFPGLDTNFAAHFRKSPALGDELLQEEASLGRSQAHHDWLELHQQIARTHDATERQRLIQCMEILEAVWGDLSS